MKKTIALILAALLALSLMTAALADAAGPWPGFGDVPAFPEEVAALIPGIPSSINDLPEDVGIDALVALRGQWDETSLKALFENGTLTLDAMGHEWTGCDIMYNSENMDWPVVTVDGAVTIELPKYLSDAAVEDVQYFMVISEDGYYMANHNYRGSDTGFPFTWREVPVDEDAAYYVIACNGEVDEDMETAPYEIEVDIDGQEWDASYDAAGNLIGIEYHS